MGLYVCFYLFIYLLNIRTKLRNINIKILHKTWYFDAKDAVCRIRFSLHPKPKMQSYLEKFWMT